MYRTGTGTERVRSATGLLLGRHWTAAALPRQRRGTDSNCHGTGTPPHILCKWSEEGTDGNDENDGSVVYPTK